MVALYKSCLLSMATARRARQPSRVVRYVSIRQEQHQKRQACVRDQTGLGRVELRGSADDVTHSSSADQRAVKAYGQFCRTLQSSWHKTRGARRSLAPRTSPEHGHAGRFARRQIPVRTERGDAEALSITSCVHICSLRCS